MRRAKTQRLLLDDEDPDSHAVVSELFAPATSRKATATAGSTIGTKKRRKKRNDVVPKRHSVGHSVGASVTAALSSKKRKQKQSEKQRVTFHAPKLKNTNSMQGLVQNRSAGKRRSVLFNRTDTADLLNGQPYVLRHDSAFDMIDGRKWDIEELLAVETEQEFHAQLSSHSKEDIIELCWDLLRSKDKSDELLGMVSTMNHDLAQVWCLFGDVM